MDGYSESEERRVVDSCSSVDVTGGASVGVVGLGGFV